MRFGILKLKNINFLLNNILKEKKNAKTPQEKSELVAQVMEILKDVNNKIIDIIITYGMNKYVKE